jgi:hypothetical protein
MPAGDGDQLCLAAAAVAGAHFRITGGADDHRADAGLGAFANRLDRGSGGNNDQRAIDFGVNGADAGVAWQPFDFRLARIDRKYAAFIAAARQIADGRIARLAGCVGSADHRHVGGLKQGFQRVIHGRAVGHQS